MPQVGGELGERVQSTLEHNLSTVPYRRSWTSRPGASSLVTLLKKFKRENKKSRGNDDDAALEAALSMAVVELEMSISLAGVRRYIRFRRQGLEWMRVFVRSDTASYSGVQHVRAHCSFASGWGEAVTVMTAGLQHGLHHPLNCGRGRASDSVDSSCAHEEYHRALVCECLSR